MAAASFHLGGRRVCFLSAPPTARRPHEAVVCRRVRLSPRFDPVARFARRPRLRASASSSPASADGDAIDVSPAGNGAVGAAEDSLGGDDDEVVSPLSRAVRDELGTRSQRVATGAADGGGGGAGVGAINQDGGFNPDERRTSPTTIPGNALLNFLVDCSRRDRRILTRLIIALLLMVGAKVLSLGVPFFYKAAVDAVSLGVGREGLEGVARLLPPPLNKFVLEGPRPLDGAAHSRVATYLSVGAVLVLVHGALRTLATVMHELRNAVFSRAQYAMGRRVTRSTFEHIHNLDTEFHSASRTGALVRIVDRGTRSVNVIFRTMIFSFLPSILEAGMVAAVLARQFSAKFAWVTLLAFVGYIGATLAINDRLIRTRKRVNLAENDASAKLTDSLTNFATVKVFNNEEYETQRYDVSLQQLENESVRNEKEYALLNIAQGVIFSLGNTAVLWMAVVDIQRGLLTVGDLVMASALLQQMWVPLQFIGWQYRELKQTLVDMENLLELLARRPSVTDAPGAPPLVVRHGEVRFENVRFGFSAAEPILRGVSFTVPAGRTTAIVGPSGSGKSTLLALLYRLYDPHVGRVLIDGHDISNVTLHSLRKAIGIIPQDTVLFNDTIGYNIAYSRPDAGRAELERVARLARVYDTIQRMPDGFDTIVGERGLRLSGGEKQRVAIARCLLKNPPILLEDEATSALDTRTEKEISASLREVGRRRTCVIVAHRLSTVVDADEILVLRQGTLVERGSHAELVQQGGVYADMWEQQKRDARHTPSDASPEATTTTAPSAVSEAPHNGGTDGAVARPTSGVEMADTSDR